MRLALHQQRPGTRSASQRRIPQGCHGSLFKWNRFGGLFEDSRGHAAGLPASAAIIIVARLGRRGPAKDDINDLKTNFKIGVYSNDKLIEKVNATFIGPIF